VRCGADLGDALQGGLECGQLLGNIGVHAPRVRVISDKCRTNWRCLRCCCCCARRLFQQSPSEVPVISLSVRVSVGSNHGRRTGLCSRHGGLRAIRSLELPLDILGYEQSEKAPNCTHAYFERPNVLVRWSKQACPRKGLRNTPPNAILGRAILPAFRARKRQLRA
jgi:hypothetical protein